MRAEDWQYAGEGGKHALFAYLPTSHEIRSDWTGLLLRLDKRYLRFAPSFVQQTGAENSSINELHEPGDIEIDMLCSLLQPYLETPRRAALSWTFVDGLRDQAIHSGSIPQRRLPDWGCDVIKNKPNTHVVVGLLIRDYRVMRLPEDEPNQTRFNMITFEIKPKAGYLTFSPFVEPRLRAKYLHTRYELLQRVYSGGLLTKGWMSGPDGTAQHSSYNPLDLFSANKERIVRALKSLIDHPQNNLRIWAGSHQVHGSGKGCPDDCWAAKFQELLPIRDWQQQECTEIESLLIDMAATVLLTEQLLPKLHRLQQLDILDGDGALLLYQLLVEKCNSPESAEHLIDSPGSLTTSDSDAIHPIMAASPLQAPTDPVNVTTLCELVTGFSAVLAQSAPALPSTETMDLYRNQAMGIACSLQIEDLVYLLRNWLLSLAMCDVSFFLTIKTNFSRMDEQPNSDAQALPGWRKFEVLKEQRPGRPGILLFRPNDGCVHNTGFSYEIHVVDVDKKPAIKLRTRKDKEAILTQAR